ncbi:hypothetical protein ACEP2M_32500, partial [Pseudomonas aeruginosa]
VGAGAPDFFFAGLAGHVSLRPPFSTGIMPTIHSPFLREHAGKRVWRKPGDAIRIRMKSRGYSQHAADDR